MKRLHFLIIVLIIALCAGGFVVFSQGLDTSQSFENLTTFVKDSYEKILEKDIHYYNQAMHYQHIESCEKIKSPEQKKECKDDVMLAKIQSKNEKLSCEDISHPEKQNECHAILIENLALSKKQKNLCNSIRDNTFHKRCRENVDAQKLSEIITKKSANYEGCHELEGSFRSQCLALIDVNDGDLYRIKAILNQDISLCKNILQETQKIACEDTIHLEQAIKNQKIQACDPINDTFKKQHCLQIVSSQTDRNILMYAMKTENLQLCSRISTPATQNHCNDAIVFTITQKTKNTEHCKKLKNTENFTICQKINTL